MHSSLMRKLELEQRNGDTLHGWESRNLDLMSSRMWAQTELSLEWFRANQIRKARQRFVGGGENTGEQRSICARILDPENQDRMKRRRAGVVHTNWDKLMMKWSGCQRWWEVSKDWKSFVKTAEELRKRSLERDKDRKWRDLLLIGKKDVQNEAEKERKKNKMKEREILGDSNLIVNLMNGKWKITITYSGRWCKRRRTCWIRLICGLWEIIWTCSSTSAEIGIKKLIVLRMWEEKKALLGTPM